MAYKENSSKLSYPIVLKALWGLFSSHFNCMHAIVLLSLFYLISYYLAHLHRQCRNDERSALLQFKQSLVIDNFVSAYP